MSADQAKRELRDLGKVGLVGSAELECLPPGVSRLRFTESGLGHFGASDEERSWHRPDGLGNVILYDLPQDRGREHRSALLCDRRMVAAAEYRHPDLHAPAYLPLCWAYMMDTQRELVERLEALPEAMQSQSVYPDERFGPPCSR